jgi:hypothetical protein
MSFEVTFTANQNNIHTGPGFLFLNALRPLYGLRPLNDGNNPPSLVDPPTPSAWAATHAYSAGAIILDSNNNVQRCTTAGTSGSSAPTWATVVGSTTTDSTVTWTLAGPSWVWAASTATTLDQQVRDGNNNIQQVVVTGTTGGSTPTWSTLYGGITQDGTTEWQNYGPTLASGAAEGAMTFDAGAKMLAVDADQYTAPIGQRLVGETAKLDGTLRELNMVVASRALANANYSSGTDPNLPSTAYEELSFGGLVLVPLPCIVVLSPRPNYVSPYRYVGATLYKAVPGKGSQFPFSLKKITDYKVEWEGNAITWRPAGDQIGQIYRQT